MGLHLISVMLFGSRKKALNKSTQFKLSQNLYTLVVMMDLMKTVSTSQKKLLPLAEISAKIKENGFNLQECSSLKISLHLISWIVPTSRKNISIKAKGLQLTKNCFHYLNCWISWKIRFKWTKGLLPFESVSEKLKWFPLAEIRFF